MCTWLKPGLAALPTHAPCGLAPGPDFAVQGTAGFLLLALQASLAGRARLQAVSSCSWKIACSLQMEHEGKSIEPIHLRAYQAKCILPRRGWPLAEAVSLYALLLLRGLRVSELPGLALCLTSLEL